MDGWNINISLLLVFSVKQSRSRSTTPTAMASTQQAAVAQSQWQQSPFTLHYWSITCHRCHPQRAERRARWRPSPCRGTERGTSQRTVRGRKAMGEKGVRGNWCCSQTEGGARDERWERPEGTLLFVGWQPEKMMEDKLGKQGGSDLSHLFLAVFSHTHAHTHKLLSYSFPFTHVITSFVLEKRCYNEIILQ